MPYPVTLSSDFGEHYPAAMRGVLAHRGIDEIHDVTHDLPAHDIRQAAFWLRELIPYYPRGVHCVVVDPGVGSDRGVAIVRTGGHVLVGPDNGVCWPVATSLSGTGEIDAFEFEHVDPASHTFHGRDVFAPVAAAVATLGIERVEELPTARPLDTPVKVTFPEPTVLDSGIEADIIAVDRFGNAITSADGSLLDFDRNTVEVGGNQVPVATHYGAVSPGSALVTVGSHGHIELAANQTAGTGSFDIDIGDTVRISW